MLTRLYALKLEDKIYSFAYAKERLIFAIEEAIFPHSEAIVPAVISKINHKNRSAFVRYGENLSGFVNLNKDSALQEGRLVTVQLVYFGGEEKQPKFRQSWQLVGKYLIYSPHTTSSLRALRVTAELRRQLELGARAFPGAWIVRSCVQFMADISQVRAEMAQLFAHAQMIMNGGSYPGCPGYLKILRSLRLADDCEVISNDSEINRQLLSYQDLWQIDAITYDPKLAVEAMVAEYRKQTTLTQYILASGANLEIYTVGGLNIIDINSGKMVLSHDKLNFLVLDEIYRQICIRNLQGIILLDLVKNISTSVQEQILNYLKKLFRCDITNTAVLGFSHSGLCELIRNRF